MELHAGGVQILHVLELAPALLAQLHDVAHVLLGRQNTGLDEGLPRLGDLRRVGVVEGGVDLDLGAVGLGDLVDDVGRRGDEVEVIFPFQPLHDDLHVKKPQEAAAEAKAQGDGIFLDEGHGGVVELELFQGVPEVTVLTAVGGVDAGEDHGLYGLVAGKRLGGGVLFPGDGVAHSGVGDGLDGGGEVAHLAGAQSVAGHHALGVEVAALHHLVLGAGGHHLDVHARGDDAVEHAKVDDDAPVGIVLAVEDQGFEGRRPVALGRRHVPHHQLQDRMDVDAVFGGDLRGVHGGDADDVLHLLLDLLGTGGGEVDLVDDRQDFKPCVDGEVGVGQGLGFDALGGIHHQHRALAGREAPRDLVVEVHVAGGVDEVEHVVLAVVGMVVEAHGAGFDGDAPLAL